jgi:cytochrome c oxidase subunit II
MPQFPWLQDATRHAAEVDTLFIVLLVLSGIVVVGVWATIIYFIAKYRRGRDADRTNPVETNNKLEITWTVIPLILSLSIFVWAARLFFEVHDVPPNALEVYVVGKQWMWKFQHTNGPSEINELHVPVGQPVKLIMTSQDVIHSLFIPAFRIKTDVLPGRYTTQWFQATMPGQYHLFCAEYCGTDHSKMGGAVIVMEPDDYQAWAGVPAGGAAAGGTPAPGGDLAATGQQLFQQIGCSGCHISQGGGAGPSLQGVFGSQVELQTGEKITADESYVHESILQPVAKVVKGYQPIMPSYEGQLSEDQLLALIAYIKSLGQPQGSQ